MNHLVESQPVPATSAFEVNFIGHRGPGPEPQPLGNACAGRLADMVASADSATKIFCNRSTLYSVSEEKEAVGLCHEVKKKLPIFFSFVGLFWWPFLPSFGE